MFDKIANAFNVVLCVIGISSPYRNVEFVFSEIYQSNGVVYAEFETEGMINDPIRELINNGYSISFEYKITTQSQDNDSYRNSVIKTIHSTNGIYLLNQKSYQSLDALSEELQKTSVIIHPMINQQSGEFSTEIEILIYSEELYTLSDLWGNQPLLKINYML